MTDIVVFSSYGNDSLAVLQLLSEYRLPEQRHVSVLYSDTGWADEAWGARVDAAEEWAKGKGFHPDRTTAMGFEALARKRKTFPRGRLQFCTSELKIIPAQKWLAENDPDCRALCVNGVRRAESLRRSTTPEFVPVSAAHGGRSLWSALASFSDESRDALIERTGFEVLPHRSMECSPCIFSNRADLRGVKSCTVDRIRDLESDLGRTMFRPKGYAGAEGIDEVMRWAWSERGQFKSYTAAEPTPETEDEPDCDSGFCGA